MSKRPKIKVPLQPLDLIVDLISVTLLILMIVYTFLVYTNLPDTIPIHFNLEGEADNFGAKITLWLLPTIGSMLFVGLIFLNKYPHIHNYKINITKENAHKNYRLSTRVIRFTNFFCQILFTLITYEIIQLAKGHESNILGVPFLIFTLVVPIAGIALIYYFQNKINK